LTGDYFVGNKLTIADLAVFGLVDDFLLDSTQKSQVEAFPALIAHYKRIAARPNIAKHLATRPHTTW